MAYALPSQAQRRQKTEFPHALHHRHEEGVGDGEQHHEKDDGEVEVSERIVELDETNHLGNGVSPRQHLEVARARPEGSLDGGSDLHTVVAVGRNDADLSKHPVHPNRVSRRMQRRVSQHLVQLAYARLHDACQMEQGAGQLTVGSRRRQHDSVAQLEV